MLTVISTMMYDYDLPAMQATFPLMANIWYTTFMIIVTNMMLWMFLGIILDSYTEARQKFLGAPTLMDDVALFLRSSPPLSGWLHACTRGCMGRPYAGVDEVLRALSHRRSSSSSASSASSGGAKEGAGQQHSAHPPLLSSHEAAAAAAAAAATHLTPHMLASLVPHLTLANASNLVLDSLAWSYSKEATSGVGAGVGGSSREAAAAAAVALPRRHSVVEGEGSSAEEAAAAYARGGRVPSYKSIRAAIVSASVTGLAGEGLGR
jgi:hypothetical protein